MNGVKWLSILTCALALLLVTNEGLSSSELRPCQIAALLPVIRKDFTKLIPVFDPDRFAIRLEDERGISVRPTDALLNPFLIRYYTLAVATINEMEAQNPRVRDPMLLVFNNFYINFLTETGIPMSCVSFYAGRSDYQTVLQIGQLAENLRGKFGTGESARSPPTTDNRLSGQGVGLDMSRKLGLTTSPFVVHLPADPPSCEPIFLKLEDGSILTNLPSVTLPPATIRIPGEPSMINTQATNVTFLLGRYVSTGLSCIESPELKGNFTSSVCNWISLKLLPTLMGSTNCVSGFPGILNLMKSLESYVLELKNSLARSSQNQDSNNNDEGYKSKQHGIIQQRQVQQVQETYSGGRNPEENLPTVGKLYAPAPWNSGYPAGSLSNNAAQRTQFSNNAVQPPVYDELVPSPPEFGEYAPLHQPLAAPPSSDELQNEVYKLHPKFNYQLRDAQALTESKDSEGEGGGHDDGGGDEGGKDEGESKTGTSPLVFAGVGTAIVFIVICCLCPLIYFLCPPSTKNVAKGKKKILKWIRKKIPPEKPKPDARDHEADELDDSEDIGDHKDWETEPLLPRSILKKPKRKSKHTRVKVKLNEDHQVSEVSVEESSDDSSPNEDVEDGDIDNELDIGGPRPKRASLPETHNYRLRPLAFESTASGTSNSDFFEEDEVSHRYDKGPVMNPSSPSIKRTEEAINSKLALARQSRPRPGTAVSMNSNSKSPLATNSRPETPPATPKKSNIPTSSASTRPGTPKTGVQAPVNNTRRKSDSSAFAKRHWQSEASSAPPSPTTEVSRKSSKDFYENTMVKWDD